jgi:hypothetical protein
MNPTITKLTHTLDNLHTPKPGETFHTEAAAKTLYQHLATHPHHHITPETLNQIIHRHTTTTHVLAA